MRQRSLLCLVLVVMGLAACEGRTADRAVEPAPIAPPHAEPAAAASAAIGPAAELAVLDARTPVPLLPMMAAHQREQMRDHLLVVEEVVGALGRDDLEAAALAAERLGTSDSMTAMCTHMGAGAPGFTELALDMHRRADAIPLAARAGDRAATLAALSDTLAACTGCHARFRQDVVDHDRFVALTGGEAPHHH